jgi:UDP-GlcNAc:undecaprenyl-phosphate GlcNAc-1-phosphate transferase
MNSVPLTWIALAALLPSFLLVYLSSFWIRRRAAGWGLIDQPNDRKVHATPTPMGGGLAIWLGVLVPFLVGTVVVMIASSNPDWLPAILQQHVEGLKSRLGSLWILLGGGTVLMILGLIDDLRGLPWRLRLAVQFLVVAVCIGTQGWQLSLFLSSRLLALVVSVIWVVLLINSFNMLDNMDGGSAGVAGIASLMLTLFVLLPGSSEQGPQLFIAGFFLVLLGSLLGFLVHNRPPARLFMGDAGSYFIGFSIGIASLLATYASDQKPHAVLAPLCIMAVPIYDFVTVIWIRLREGRSPFQPDKSHFSHRLVELGMTRGQAVLTMYFATATCGLGALLLPQVDGFLQAGIIVLLVICVLGLVAILETVARRKIRS